MEARRAAAASLAGLLLAVCKIFLDCALMLALSRTCARRPVSSVLGIDCRGSGLKIDGALVFGVFQNSTLQDDA